MRREMNHNMSFKEANQNGILKYKNKNKNKKYYLIPVHISNKQL